MYVIKMKDIRQAIKPNSEKYNFTLDDKKYQIHLSKQKTGFGEKSFLVCPHCGKRYIELYIINGFIRCRNCCTIEPYWGIKNSTKGGFTEIQYRMENIAAKHNINIDYPFDYLKFAQDKRVLKTRFNKIIKILQALENMRSQNIFYKTTYKPKTIDSVIKGTHPNFNKYTLKELRDYFFPW